MDALEKEILSKNKGTTEPLNGGKENCSRERGKFNDILGRHKQLKAKLSSILDTLKSNISENVL